MSNNFRVKARPFQLWLPIFITGDPSLATRSTITLLSLIELLGLRDEGVNVDTNVVRFTSAHLGQPSDRNPAFRCEVGTLGAIKTHVETGMIPSWIGDDELPLLLDEHVGTNRVTSEIMGRDGVGLVTEKLAAAVRVREVLCENETISCMTRDNWDFNAYGP